jgi:hypothetical protein
MSYLVAWPDFIRSQPAHRAPPLLNSFPLYPPLLFLQHQLIIDYLTEERSLPRGPDRKPLTTRVDIVEARDMPFPLRSRALTESWIQDIKDNFSVRKFHGGQLLVDASVYKKTFPGRPLNNTLDLQHAVEQRPEMFKLWPAAGRCV